MSGMRESNSQQGASPFGHIYRREFYILRVQGALCIAPMDTLFIGKRLTATEL